MERKPEEIKDSKDSQALAEKLAALGPKKGEVPVRVKVFTMAREVGTSNGRIKDLYARFKSPITSFMRDYRMEVELDGDEFVLTEKVKW
jgi:hypothetical protein